MNVEVRLFATLTTYRPGVASGEPSCVGLDVGATLSDLLRALAIPSEDVHLAMIDGRICHDRGALLSDGSRVGLFPPVGGG